MKTSSNSKTTELATTTTAMTPSIHRKLSALTNQDNAMTISNYFVALESEINPSKNYKQDIVDVLCYLSIRSNKDFKQMKRLEDILAFLMANACLSPRNLGYRQYQLYIQHYNNIISYYSYSLQLHSVHSKNCFLLLK